MTKIGDTPRQFTESYGQVVIPDSVTAITPKTFQSAQIEELQLGSGITVIEGETFQESGISAVKFSPNLTEIFGWAFSGNNISSIDLPESLTFIDMYAFEKNKLTEVTLPDSVVTVDRFAFDKNMVTKTTFGKSVQSVGDSVLGPVYDPVRAVFNGPVPRDFMEIAAKGASLGFDRNTVILFQPEFGDASTPYGFTSPEWMGYKSFPSYVNVNFVSNGGSSVASLKVPFDSALTLPNAPTKAGNIFTGWHFDQDLKVPFDISSMQRSTDFTLYAAWKADDTVTPDPGGPGTGGNGDGGTKPVKTGTLPNTGGSSAELMATAATAILLLAAGTVLLVRRMRANSAK